MATLARDPAPLVGSLDWVTKQFLLRESGEGAEWETRKKIDLRYHELSAEGYFRRLEQAGLPTTLLEPREVEQAVRTPPPDSPATARGRFIREFSQGAEPLTANWNSVFIGSGFRARVVPLARYVRARAEGPPLEEEC